MKKLLLILTTISIISINAGSKKRKTSNKNISKLEQANMQSTKKIVALTAQIAALKKQLKRKQLNQRQNKSTETIIISSSGGSSSYPSTPTYYKKPCDNFTWCTARGTLGLPS